MADLSGVWSGTYIYPGSLDPVSFVAEIRDLGDGLSGVISEPAPLYMGGGEIEAVINGACIGKSVHFTKIYDELDHFLNPVDYSGTLDEDENEISGDWTIKGELSGGFVMTRSAPVRAEETIEEYIEVDR